MKQTSILLIACLFFQIAQGQYGKARHSFQVQTGFAYASDLAYEEEMNRHFQGVGYQYTTKSNWYVGTDVQYHRNQLNSDRLLPLQMQGEGALYACTIPGAWDGTGYFFLP